MAVDWHHFLVDRATACLIEALRAQTTYTLLAEHMRREAGDSLDPDFLREVVENQLPPAIFRPSEDGRKTTFSWRIHLFSGAALDPLVRVTSRLVNKPLAMALLVLLIAVDVAVLAKWIQDPVPLRGGGMTHWLPVMGLVLVGVLIHELGHVSALRRFGRRSGGIGFGIYWIFPTFYADVSEAWRLRARHRAVVDAGGLYFQGIYMVGIGAWALVSRDPELFTRLGCDGSVLYPDRRGTVAALKALKRGECLAILPDVYFESSTTMAVPFLGRLLRVMPGTAFFATRTNSTVVPLYAAPGASVGFDGAMGNPIDPSRYADEDEEQSQFQFMTALVSEMERQFREVPVYWNYWASLRERSSRLLDRELVTSEDFVAALRDKLLSSPTLLRRIPLLGDGFAAISQ